MEYSNIDAQKELAIINKTDIFISLVAAIKRNNKSLMYFKTLTHQIGIEIYMIIHYPLIIS